MSLRSSVVQKFLHKRACGESCNCGCGKPVEVFSEVESIPVEVNLYRVGSLDPDGESYMSVQGLQSMRDHAEDLLGQINNETPLPDWVEAKITRAAQDLNDVYEYMNHGYGQKSAKLRRR